MVSNWLRGEVLYRLGSVLDRITVRNWEEVTFRNVVRDDALLASEKEEKLVEEGPASWGLGRNVSPERAGEVSKRSEAYNGLWSCSRVSRT